MSSPVNWMLVSSPENFEISRGMGFTLAGMKSRHRKKAEKVKPGDRVIFYLTGIQAIGGIATVTGPYFEGRDDLWQSKKEGEGYPFRFPIAPHLILGPEDFVPVIGLVPHMVYTKKWPEAHWRLAFQGNVHILPDEDYALIESAVQNARRATADAR